MDDANSFLYQTVGHPVIPLYAEALGLPLFRQEILGSAINQEKSYWPDVETGTAVKDRDETESLLVLLQNVLAEHPEIDAVSTGAILSDYQRTRVESVSLRLGLTPLSYLWQYPYLPPVGHEALLNGLTLAGFDARIIKVASGGLDESVLWENVAEERGKRRLTQAMARYGLRSPGAILGEGGEYETLVLDGPAPLWKKRILVEPHNRTVLQQGSGAALVRVAAATLQEKSDGKPELSSHNPRQTALVAEKLPRPKLLDDVFAGLESSVPQAVIRQKDRDAEISPPYGVLGELDGAWNVSVGASTMYICNMVAPGTCSSAEEQIKDIIHRLRRFLLTDTSSSPDDIIYTTIHLRYMHSFAAVNREYGLLFSKPNPPARVTIGLGNMLPSNVAVMMSVILDLGNPCMREGLHVQSRSYWAPANIGPYSQAISVSKKSEPQEHAVSEGALVYVAGQIPLDPASMTVCSKRRRSPNESGQNDFRLQTLLSLQHLWRIGRVMNVDWWIGGIAFIVKNSEIKDQVSTAWQSWRQIHAVAEDAMYDAGVADNDCDFDVWDQKHKIRTEASEDDQPLHRIPNLAMITVIGSSKPISPFLAVEVAELPRGCDVEWAATGLAREHASITHLSEGSLSMDICTTTRRTKMANS
ncbi:MAG: hypothetical protein M1833_006552 [Piccolia ochrophora]|nr:MAG: hypothetical protein M1833_006552 [Piccolia ochrophora]